MGPKKKAAKSKKPTAKKPKSAQTAKTTKKAMKRAQASSATGSKKSPNAKTNVKPPEKKPAAKIAPKPVSKPVPVAAAKSAPAPAAKAPPASSSAAPPSAPSTKPTKAAPTGPIHGGISDEAVRKTTGRGWDEWFAMIDAAGGAKLDHRGIVAIVGPHLTNSEWWGQMVTVAYEQARGLRAKHERPDGFQVGASRVLDVSVSRIYAAFFDDGLRAKWLSEPITIKKATMDRSLRLAWKDNTPIDVTLFSKGESRASVAVQHGKLKDEETANARKAFWKAALDRLSIMLTGA